MNGEFEHFEKIVEETNKASEVQTVDTTTEQVEVITTTEETAEKAQEVVVPEEIEAPAEEVEKVEVTDPLADLPDDVKEYAIAKKENKDLTFEDFQKEKNFDINSLSILDTAREKAIRESGGKITRENVDAYLEKKTGIMKYMK